MRDNLKDLLRREICGEPGMEVISLEISGSADKARTKDLPVINFEGGFNSYNIHKLIYDIETIRQSGKHTVMDLYFSSHGGYYTDMQHLITYIERLQGLHINIIVTGYVCSAGYWILPLLNLNEHVTITFTEAAEGMIHLADVKLSVRDTYTKDHNFTNFAHDRLAKTNAKLLEVAQHIGLSEEQVTMIKEGKDVWLDRDELKDTLNEYYNYWFVTSGKALNDYNGVAKQIEELQRKKDLYARVYKHQTSKDIEDVLHPRRSKKKKETVEDNKDTSEEVSADFNNGIESGNPSVVKVPRSKRPKKK